MDLSRHASVRCQQRGIPPLIRQWLHDYGSEVISHGATKRYFDHRAKKRLAAAVGAQVVDRLGGASERLHRRRRGAGRHGRSPQPAHQATLNEPPGSIYGNKAV